MPPLPPTASTRTVHTDAGTVNVKVGLAVVNICDTAPAIDAAATNQPKISATRLSAQIRTRIRLGATSLIRVTVRAATIPAPAKREGFCGPLPDAHLVSTSGVEAAHVRSWCRLIISCVVECRQV